MIRKAFLQRAALGRASGPTCLVRFVGFVVDASVAFLKQTAVQRISAHCEECLTTLRVLHVAGRRQTQQFDHQCELKVFRYGKVNGSETMIQGWTLGPDPRSLADADPTKKF